MATNPRPPVHPHARGERFQRRHNVALDYGSSPRSWGTPVEIAEADADGRFIPTLVGNAVASTRRPGRSPVHPHARGERARMAAYSSRCSGSSPRSWGTRRDVARRARVGRFIPTLVGNAPYGASQAPRKPVHPHARGERNRRGINSAAVLGSSPRSWGTQRVLQGLAGGDRFIPTLVGNAGGRRDQCRFLTVHPHARGEREPISAERSSCGGSSPRSWGTLSGPGQCSF